MGINVLCYLVVISIKLADTTCTDDTCDCGHKFVHFYGLYILIIILHMTFRLRMNCLALKRVVKRREIKQILRPGTLTFCCLFIICFALMIDSWYSDVKSDVCGDESILQNRLTLFTLVLLVFTGLQVACLIVLSLNILCEICIRFDLQKEMEGQGLVYESSDEEDDRRWIERRLQRQERQRINLLNNQMEVRAPQRRVVESWSISSQQPVDIRLNLSNQQRVRDQALTRFIS